MIGTSQRDPTVIRNTIPESKLEWLGRGHDHDYARYKGVEFAVDRYARDPGDYARQTGEIFVMRVRREVIDGTDFEHHQTHRAVPVPSGTYASLAAKAEARARKSAAERPMRSWDVLTALVVMQRREPRRAAAGMSASVLDTLEHLPATSEQEREVIAGAVNLLDRSRPKAIIEVGGNEPPDRSPAGIIAYLAGRGVELTLVRGRLLARSRTPIRTDDKALIEQAEELIVGVLRGSPVICSLCAESAVSLAFPRAPMCASHLEARQ